MRRQPRPPDTVMLGSKPAAGRYQPIASCPKCRTLVRLRDEGRGPIGVFGDFEHEAIRVLLAKTGLFQDFAPFVNGSSHHECFADDRA